ncbi:chorion class A protein PC292-like [Pieris brassicae]|uniref:chorion class A protein PC292-like n=1 Tax=Pieris brassicae TaxID=7116 RepID=UPI001E66092D|nr:chorion class A protein PC292-like [Pieris brassicae]
MNYFTIFLVLQTYFIQNALAHCTRLPPAPANIPECAINKPVIPEDESSSGFGTVSVFGDLPLSGATQVVGQVPVLGVARFSGSVPARGFVTISGGCGCGSQYIESA